MEWVIWALSIIIAVIGGYFLNEIGGKSAPPTVSIYTNESLLEDNKREEKSLTFFEHNEDEEDEEKDPENKESSEPEELVIVAFRLPVKVEKKNGRWVATWDDPFARNVFADLRVLHSEKLIVKWVGTVPGPDIPKEEQFDLEDELAELNCFPVFLPRDIKQKFYKGFCKGTLWPLFHYVMPQAIKLDTDFGTRWDAVWQAYTAGNMFFSKIVTRVNENNDNMIWIHGYHLLSVPSLVRRRLPKARIGLFVHEPWPSSEVFRSLPARENLLRGMLACDLIGFQTYDYVRHFLSCVKRLMNLDYKSLAGGSIGITYAGRSVAIRISHVGTRSEFFKNLTASSEVKREMKAIEGSLGLNSSRKKKKLIVSVDYMDLTKGPQMKLQSFYRFLRSHPHMKDSLTFTQVILPSSNVDQDEVRKLVMKEVKQIRDEFGQHIITTDDNPSLEKLVAYYRLSQVAIISTFWDGLNLIPYEYTASQGKEDPGALVISEFMGCSRSLSGVIRVNPWSIQNTADAIKTAVEMSLAKRRSNHARRYRYVMNHSLELWAKSFLRDLKKASAYNSNLRFVQVGFSSDVTLVGLRSDFAKVDMESIRKTYGKSKSRLILLDYDGTLIEVTKSGATPPPQLKETLRTLCEDEANIVFIISGRTREKLIRWFGDIENLGLAAEKGCFVRWPKHVLSYISSLPKSTERSRERRMIALQRGTRQSPWIKCSALEMKSGSAAAATTTAAAAAAAAEGGEDMKGNENKSAPTTPTTASNNSQWYSLCDSDEKGWKELAMPVIKAYDERTDGAMIEDKEYGIVWKFEGADPDYGQMQAREMQKYLMELIADDVIDIVVYDDNRILEILPKGVNKGLTTSLLIDTLRSYMKDPLFLMAVGDDVSDEKMFSALQNSPVLQRDDLKYEIVTCCVGLKPSQAHYYAHDPEEVRESLRELALVAEQMSPSSTWTNQNSDSGMALGGGGGFQRTGGGGFGRSGNLAGLARSGGF